MRYNGWVLGRCLLLRGSRTILLTCLVLQYGVVLVHQLLIIFLIVILQVKYYNSFPTRLKCRCACVWIYGIVSRPFFAPAVFVTRCVLFQHSMQRVRGYSRTYA